MNKIAFIISAIFLLGFSSAGTQNSTQAMEQNTSKPKLVYHFDALCGWCYGFSPVIAEIHAKYKDQIDFEVVSGGLCMGNNSGPIDEVAPYIKAGAYKDVESYTGVKFGDGFVKGTMEEGSMVLNSLPPAVALCIVKEEAPEKAFEFAGILHRAIYVDGLEPEDVESYGKYAARIGLDAEAFVEKMRDPAYEKMARADFQRSSASGVNGYPTAILHTESGTVVLNRGYLDQASFEAKLQNALK